jgi:hypothetical protein
MELLQAFLKITKVIKEIKNCPENSKIIINNDTTILIAHNGKKYISRPTQYETYDKETGIAMCMMKYIFGSRRKFLKFVDMATDQTPDHWSRND